MRRGRGQGVGYCGLRRFWHSLAVYLSLCDGIELSAYFADEQNIAAIVMSRNRFMVQK